MNTSDKSCGLSLRRTSALHRWVWKVNAMQEQSVTLELQDTNGGWDGYKCTLLICRSVRSRATSIEASPVECQQIWVLRIKESRQGRQCYRAARWEHDTFIPSSVVTLLIQTWCWWQGIVEYQHCDSRKNPSSKGIWEAQRVLWINHCQGSCTGYATKRILSQAR